MRYGIRETVMLWCNLFEFREIVEKLVWTPTNLQSNQE